MDLNKSDIARNAEATSDGIITPIALVIRVVTKEDTRSGLGRELDPLTRG